MSRNARPSTNRSMPNILAQLSAEKQWVGDGGVYYTRPSLPISIKYKQEGVGIQVKFCSLGHKGRFAGIQFRIQVFFRLQTVHVYIYDVCE
jgi:hypothetical protein